MKFDPRSFLFPPTNLRRVGGPLAAALIGIVTLTTPVHADDADNAQLLEDFVHFTAIAKPDLAAAYGQQLLDSGLSDEELVTLLENTMDQKRFDAALARGLLVPELESVSAEIGLRMEAGRLGLARNADRIDQAIDMLVGTQRERLLAEKRLEAAGEYAVPGLLRRITDGRDEQLRSACVRMLAKIGRVAATPLAEAIGSIDPQSQRIVSEILAEIGYEHAAPYLKALALDASAATPARDAAEAAYRRLVGGDMPLSTLFTMLANAYFEDRGSLVAYPYEATNNVWRYDAYAGLVPTAVPTEIFNEVMAMRAAARAVGADVGNEEAIATYVAANLRRENELTPGEIDPVYGNARYTPEFYATVYGTRIGQMVLGKAVDHLDTPLVRDAIAALAQTTGGSNLFETGGRRPLIEALGYPDRRVQYDAALTLGRALPGVAFDGGEKVVPLLASAVRTGGETFAMVIAEDEENRRVEASRLEQLGFTVVGAEASFEALDQTIRDSIGIDLVTVRMETAEAAVDAERAVRAGSRTAATPVVIVAGGVESVGLGQQFRENPRTAVTRVVSDDAFRNVVEELLRVAAGGMLDESEAEIYAIESLSALRDIAIAGTAAYDIRDAEIALLDAIDMRTGGTKALVAEILALIGTPASQDKLFATAMRATGSEQVDLLDRVAASVKHFGLLADRRYVASIADLVNKSTGDLADAAARVHGAMNLPGTDAARLIDG